MRLFPTQRLNVHAVRPQTKVVAPFLLLLLHHVSVPAAAGPHTQRKVLSSQQRLGPCDVPGNCASQQGCPDCLPSKRSAGTLLLLEGPVELLRVFLVETADLLRPFAQVPPKLPVSRATLRAGELPAMQATLLWRELPTTERTTTFPPHFVLQLPWPQCNLQQTKNTWIPGAETAAEKSATHQWTRSLPNNRFFEVTRDLPADTEERLRFKRIASAADTRGHADSIFSKHSAWLHPCGHARTSIFYTSSELNHPRTWVARTLVFGRGQLRTVADTSRTPHDITPLVGYP